MWIGMNGFRVLAMLHFQELFGFASVAVVGGTMWFRMRGKMAAGRKKRRLAEEEEAYGRLELRLSQYGSTQAFGRSVCETVSQKSSFYRTVLLLRDGEGRLAVVASAGAESLWLQALNAWGGLVAEAERQGGEGVRRGDGGLGMRVGRNSFAVVLGEGPDEAGGGRAIVIPLRTAAGKIVGTLAVGADSILSVPRRMVEEAIFPLEMLGARLGRALEDAALAERLQQTEKLAGLGLLAGGMAHALNNPLTAVLGFAELIADTSDEARVKTDAGKIVREALRMRETVDALLEFWQPPSQLDEVVEITELVRELADSCRETLVGRGVQLVVEGGAEVPVVRGSRDRLRQVLEHLLNNAAQAVATAAAQWKDDGQEIRLAVSNVEGSVHVVVSDTGPGFRELGRAFDPFHRTRQQGQGTGLGLSLCYAIVREHGGEIRAYNVAPHGAVVVVELPLGQAPKEKKDAMVEDRVLA
jgi:signal transduction histidine kinase